MKVTKNITTIKDMKGRSITLKEPTGAEKLKLFLIIGENAHNATYAGICNSLMHVKKIDNKEIPPFQSLKDIESLYDLLGDHGVLLVTETVVKNYISIH